VTPQQVGPSGKPSVHRLLTSRVNERFERNDYSLSQFDEIEGPEGDGSRLIRYALRAVSGYYPEHIEIRHLRHAARTFRCTVATVTEPRGNRICLLHVPRSVFEKPSRNELDRFEVAVRQFWKRLRQDDNKKISQILIFSWRGNKLRTALRQLQRDLEQDEQISIEFRPWDDVVDLKNRVADYGAQFTEDDFIEISKDDGFKAEILRFLNIDR
jgi:hypothetical protein